jgi:hypothetical protein
MKAMRAWWARVTALFSRNRIRPPRSNGVFRDAADVRDRPSYGPRRTPGGGIGNGLPGRLLLVLAGVVIGSALALASSRFVTSLLFGITARDLAAFAGAAAVMALAALFSTLLPARRAARMDPMVALRTE